MFVGWLEPDSTRVSKVVLIWQIHGIAIIVHHTHRKPISLSPLHLSAVHADGNRSIYLRISHPTLDRSEGR